ALRGLRPHQIERAGIDPLAAEGGETVRTIGVGERHVRAVLRDAGGARGLRVAVERPEYDVVTGQGSDVLAEPQPDDRTQPAGEGAQAALVVRIVDGDGLLAAGAAEGIRVEARDLAVVAQEAQRGRASRPRGSEYRQPGHQGRRPPHPPPWTSHRE